MRPDAAGRFRRSRKKSCRSNAWRKFEQPGAGATDGTLAALACLRWCQFWRDGEGDRTTGGEDHAESLCRRNLRTSAPADMAAPPLVCRWPLAGCPARRHGAGGADHPACRPGAEPRPHFCVSSPRAAGDFPRSAPGLPVDAPGQGSARSGSALQGRLVHFSAAMAGAGHGVREIGAGELGAF